MTDAPITRPCPVCNAQPSEPCSAPTSTGRRYVKWFHYRREGQ